MGGMKESLTLIQKTLSNDAYQTETQTQRTVYADKLPLHSNAFHAAAASGFDLQHIMKVYAFEYAEEQTAVYNGREYDIYRTYQPNDDWVELYLSSKGKKGRDSL